MCENEIQNSTESQKQSLQSSHERENSKNFDWHSEEEENCVDSMIAMLIVARGGVNCEFKSHIFYTLLIYRKI